MCEGLHAFFLQWAAVGDARTSPWGRQAGKRVGRQVESGDAERGCAKEVLCKEAMFGDRSCDAGRAGNVCCASRQEGEVYLMLGLFK